MIPWLGRWLALTICALALILGGALRVAAQANQPTLPESAFAVSHEATVYKRQLQMAAQFGRRVLAGLQAASPNDETPLDERVQREARDTYGLLRSARAGMDRARTAQKYPDPVLDLTLKRVTQAWHLSRTTVDQLSWGNTRQQYLDKAIPTLTEALRLLDQALMMMP